MVNKLKTKLILYRKLIQTIHASENELRLSHFHRRWKALGELSRHDLIFAIWKILHTCPLPIPRAENIEPIKRRLGPKKWLTRLERTKVFAITAQNSTARYIRMVVRSLTPHPWMDTIGCLAHTRDCLLYTSDAA